MRVYFLSEKLCSLTVNGAYLGLIDGFERAAELDPCDGLFCELTPCGGEFLPFGFLLDENFLISPPPQAALYYTERGVALFFSRFVRADQSLRVIKQERLSGSLLTLIVQGKVQLALDNETGFHLTELPDPFETCTFSPRSEGFLLTADDAFALLSRKGDLLLLSEGKVLENGETLTAEVPFRDCLGHTALCHWKDGKQTECTIRTAGAPAPATFALALFESALIGADASPFLCEELAGKADSLKEYLGDFRSVLLTDSPEKVGLVYERRERVFDVRYFSVEMRDGKIANIRPL